MYLLAIAAFNSKFKAEQKFGVLNSTIFAGSFVRRKYEAKGCRYALMNTAALLYLQTPVTLAFQIAEF